MNERLIIRRFGSPIKVVERIASEEITRPLAAGEVLLRILASPINPADINWIAGTYGITPSLPETPGSEACAEVIDSRSEKFPQGARVIFLSYANGWQKFRIAHQHDLLEVPRTFDAIQASMLKVNPATAWLMLRQMGEISPRQAMVQNAANSGVGQCVAQFAHAMGIPCLHFLRRPEDHDFLRSLGAESVFSDDAEGYENARDYLDRRQLKAVLACNAVGGDSALRMLNLLEPNALHLTYGAMSRRPLTIPNKFVIFQNMRIHGFWLSSWMNESSPDQIRAVYTEMLSIWQRHGMKQRVHSCHSLDDFSSALVENTSEQKLGKVLFQMEQ